MEYGSSMEWKDLYFTIKHENIKGFLSRLVEKNFRLMWIHQQECVYLAITHGDSMYQIPFLREGSDLVLSLKHLPVFHEDLKDCLQISVAEYKGSGLLNLKTGDTISSLEFKQGILYKIKEYDQNENILKETLMNKEFDNARLASIAELEINYYLMELHDYMELKDTKKIAEIKNKLKELTDHLKSYQS